MKGGAIDVSQTAASSQRYRRRYASLSLRGENRLRYHAVDPLGAVDHLGDVIIHGHARDHVGLLAG